MEMTAIPAGRRGRKSGLPQPRYADLASSQRLETQQNPERETGEQDAIKAKTYDVSGLFRAGWPSTQAGESTLDMI